jgi:hypothetical protein
MLFAEEPPGTCIGSRGTLFRVRSFVMRCVRALNVVAVAVVAAWALTPGALAGENDVCVKQADGTCRACAEKAQDANVRGSKA